MGATTALIAPSLNGPLKLQDVQVDDPRPDEALVEIHAVGICHADLACLHGKIPVKFPNIFGHEGIVLKTGNKISSVSPGDAVLLSYNACNNCPSCSEGFPAYCVNMVKLNFGGTRLDGRFTTQLSDGTPVYSNFFGQSSFTRLAVVNAASLVPVSQTTPLSLLAPLGCGMQTGAGVILNTLDVQPGDSVVIIGTGAVGMAAIMAARMREAHTVIGVDINSERLDLAQSLGATRSIQGAGSNLASQIKEICGAGVRYAVDTTGVPEIVERMIDSLAPRGKAVSIGAPSVGSKVKIDVFSQITMGRQYLGCNQGDSIPQQMIPYLVEQHASGKFAIEKIVRTYDMKDFAPAIADMESGRVIKPVLVWGKQY